MLEAFSSASGPVVASKTWWPKPLIKRHERSAKGIVTIYDQYFVNHVSHERKELHKECQSMAPPEFSVKFVRDGSSMIDCGAIVLEHDCDIVIVHVDMSVIVVALGSSRGYSGIDFNSLPGRIRKCGNE